MIKIYKCGVNYYYLIDCVKFGDYKTQGENPNKCKSPKHRRKFLTTVVHVKLVDRRVIFANKNKI